MKFNPFQKTVIVLLLFLILTVACQGTPSVDPVQAEQTGQTLELPNASTNIQPLYNLLDESGDISGSFYVVDDGNGHLCRIVLADGNEYGEANGTAIDCVD